MHIQGFIEMGLLSGLVQVHTDYVQFRTFRVEHVTLNLMVFPYIFYKLKLKFLTQKEIKSKS